MKRKKKVVRKTMARRRRARRYYPRARKVYARARGGGGKFKAIIDGVIAGAGGSVATGFIGPWGQPLAYGAVGYFRNNPTLKTLAGVAVGQQLGQMLPFGGNNGGNGGGGVR